MNPWQYNFGGDLLYGITHGFDITFDLLLMAWNFKLGNLLNILIERHLKLLWNSGPSRPM